MIKFLVFMTLLSLGGLNGEDIEAIADRVLKKIGEKRRDIYKLLVIKNKNTIFHVFLPVYSQRI